MLLIYPNPVGLSYIHISYIKRHIKHFSFCHVDRSFPVVPAPLKVYVILTDNTGSRKNTKHITTYIYIYIYDAI